MSEEILYYNEKNSIPDIEYFKKFSKEGNWIGLEVGLNNTDNLLYDFGKKEFTLFDSSHFDGYIPNGIFKGDQEFINNIKAQNFINLKANGLIMGPSRNDWDKKEGVLFLDRDGIINEDLGYSIKKDDNLLIEGIVELIAWANSIGMKVIVLTNQSGVARGHYSEEELKDYHDYLDKLLKKKGASVFKWLYCPFHPEKGVGPYKRKSLNRKPHPGMLLKAMQELPIDLERSWMIGDKVSDAFDLEGMRNLHLLGKYDLSAASWPVFKSLIEIKHYLMKEVCTAK